MSLVVAIKVHFKILSQNDVIDVIIIVWPVCCFAWMEHVRRGKAKWTVGRNCSVETAPAENEGSLKTIDTGFSRNIWKIMKAGWNPNENYEWMNEQQRLMMSLWYLVAAIEAVRSPSAFVSSIPKIKLREISSTRMLTLRNSDFPMVNWSCRRRMESNVKRLAREFLFYGSADLIYSQDWTRR